MAACLWMRSDPLAIGPLANFGILRERRGKKRKERDEPDSKHVVKSQIQTEKAILLCSQQQKEVRSIFGICLHHLVVRSILWLSANMRSSCKTIYIASE
jgi:hypothetical protein